MKAFKGRKLDPAKEVWVYRNLNMKGGPWYSVMQDGKVIARTTHLMLEDARFVVREKGRQRVLIQRRKNVHAFVVGRIGDKWSAQPVLGPFLRGMYDPYVCGHFRVINVGGVEEWMDRAEHVILDGTGLSVLNHS